MMMIDDWLIIPESRSYRKDCRSIQLNARQSRSATYHDIALELNPDNAEQHNNHDDELKSIHYYHDHDGDGDDNDNDY